MVFSEQAYQEHRIMDQRGANAILLVQGTLNSQDFIQNGNFEGLVIDHTLALGFRE